MLGYLQQMFISGYDISSTVTLCTASFPARQNSLEKGGLPHFLFILYDYLWVGYWHLENGSNTHVLMIIHTHQSRMFYLLPANLKSPIR